ncbi:ribose 5-phosphate isomerase B [Clostridium beijerinckii]|uniref:Ribose 5-phosphate isomerase B n=1 Tax=Clostridium beijerinckii TaxID=1520 RepID=A0AAX0B5E8_CLOBE|nr:ribose 5-phosphate isomerase B [Clostridium beijerinckii]NRT32503.1 ribose 5-phosphate isomerase B [Clostridium beijerinckii]NRT90322.1 ribose 5-phosphate isomerase B [Clostridium beijerinckii]NRU36102.1 ribose 5-phosphate isomerase B [Clostridium beijerinckii]NSB00618.1 ribose 5-phosphate isomerase B [Clostridium beijerinckii]OOM64157.1 putative sugar phosphate isomerase YwlF [Clostridium beijerinckii]
MKIALGCDHGGINLKGAIKKYLISKNIEVEDFGTNSSESVNYPEYAIKVSKAVTSKECDLGILCCGTGIGMSIAANKHKGIRAAVVGDCFSAKMTREHNNTNVLCLGERVTGEGLALTIVDTWINSKFQGGRHSERLALVEEIENK